MNLTPIALVTVAGLLGAIPFGLLLAKRFLAVDLQTVGSGNIGATNAARAGGKGFGAFVLLLDAVKGFVGPWAGAVLGLSPAWVAGAGLAAVLGHCYSPFLRFNGGKGVATSLGVILALDPWLGGAAVLTYGVVLALTRISAIGSLAGTGMCVLVAWTWPGERFDLTLRVTLIAICGLIVWRHRSNLAALRHTKADD